LAKSQGVAFIVLLTIAAISRSAIGTRLDSVTVDEPWHIVAGTEYVRTGDFRLNPEHPPLVKLWVGAAMPSSFTLRPGAPLVEKIHEREMVEETFFHDNDFRGAQGRARLAMWSFHGVLLIVFGLLLWRVFGLAWAIGTLAFLAIEPTVGAHLPVVMTDLPLAMTLGLAALCGGLVLATWSWGWTLAFGVALGLALGAKHSALAGLAGLAAVCGLAALIPAFRGHDLGAAAGRAAKLLLAGGLAIAVLWGQYGFRYHAAPSGADGFNRAMTDKLADLKIEHWRRAIAFADEWRLLPRSYLWGLSDTVRAGVEGRAENMQLLWGVRHKGRPPWFTWPSYVMVKVPLALLALALLGAGALWHADLTPAARASLLALLGVGTAHVLALSGSQGAYAGVRHALPIVLVLAVLAGGAAGRAAQGRSKQLAIAVGACFVAAAAMTLREPRLWEYHNELVGGTTNAWRYFANEGIDLGQRTYEVERYVREVIKPTGQRYYLSYDNIVEAETRALGLSGYKKVEGLDDTNVAGLWEGYFLYRTTDVVPFPETGWDPDTVFKDLTRIARLGSVEVWWGRQRSPDIRAGWMAQLVSEYVYKKGGNDWELVATRLQEVLAVLPWRWNSSLELGNAYLRLGRRAEALQAYRQPFSHLERGILDDLSRRDLEGQIARLERGDDLVTIEPLRPRGME
jgi:Bacterial transcriptional activator domain